jgi:hypothetical protein
MSTSREPYRARHAAPRGATAPSAALRRAACAAAAVAAGAVPLVSAGAAQAATGPLGDLFPAGAAQSATLSGVALPSINAPLGLSDAALPLNQATLALAPTQAMMTGTQQLTDHLTSALPLNNLVPSVLPDANNPLQVAPNLLQTGALGNLSQGLAPQTQDLTGAVVGQTAPLVNGLHQAGVPTVGDVTGQVSAATLPGVGTVGGLTKSLPVTSVLGPNSPVTGALNNLGQL